MRQIRLMLLVLVFALSLAAAALGGQPVESAKALVARDIDHVPGEVLVRFHPDIDTTRTDALILPARLSGLECLHTIKLCRMKITDGSSVEEMAWAAQQDPTVEYAEPNHLDHTLGIPGPELPLDGPLKEATDPNYSLQWHYPLIHLPEAWNKTTGKSSVVIAVVDTGVRFDHTDLGPRLSANGYDFIKLDNNPTDPDNGHGTHVSGTIGAVTNNGLGVAGVTWRNPILPIRTIGTGGGTHFQFAQGFLYAAGLLKAPDPVNPTPAKVINYSGGGEDGPTKRDAVAKVNAAKVLMVVAAGNNGESGGAIDYPGGYSKEFPMVICVGATNFGNGSPTRAPYSSYGPAINVVAPGGDTSEDTDHDGHVDGVLSTTWNFGTGTPGYQFWNGTSMATPHVTGVAALLLGRGCSTKRIRPILQSSATDLGPTGFDNEYGHGLINAQAALDMAGRDLRVRTLTGLGATSRTELASGHAVFKWRVMNKGCVSAPKTIIKFWLSSDTLLSSDDMLLGAKAVPALKGEASTDLMQVSLPLKAAVNSSQRWYVIAKVDPKGTMGEWNENNNQKACRLTDK
jgi:serine protease